MNITLSNKYTGALKEVKVGFSWTTFFFGCFPALFRGDIKWAAIMCLLALCTLGLSWFVMPFLYNKFYIKDLLNKGFFPSTDASARFLVSKGIITQDHLEHYNSTNGKA